MAPEFVSQVISGRVSLGCGLWRLYSVASVLQVENDSKPIFPHWMMTRNECPKTPAVLMILMYKISWRLDPNRLFLSRIYHACWSSGEIPPKGPKEPKERGRWNRHQEPPWYSFPYDPMEFIFLSKLTCNAKLLPDMGLRIAAVKESLFDFPH